MLDRKQIDWNRPVLFRESDGAALRYATDAEVTACLAASECEEDAVGRFLVGDVICFVV